MKWRFKEGVPIYTQIMEYMKTCIAGGQYCPGEKIPAVRELALEAGVNPNTMQKALSELEREGLLFSERTSGRFVTKDEGILKDMKKKLGEKYIEEMFENLGRLGFSEDEIREAVNERKKETKESLPSKQTVIPE